MHGNTRPDRIFGKVMLQTFLRPVQWLYCLYALLLFVAGMIVALPFVAFFSLQGSKKGGDRIYLVCRWWDTAWLTLIGIRRTLVYESVPDSDRCYIFISNHISYLDIPMILRAIPRNSLRILGKAEMAKWPIFGYIYSRAVVMVNRSSIRDRSRSVRDLKTALNMGLSVFIFPEGTFNETGQPLKEFYDGAFRIAIETQTPLQPILFLDTYDRMHYSSLFSLRPGRTRAVFLPSVEVEGLRSADVPQLKQQVYRQMEEAVLRWRAAWIRDAADASVKLGRDA
ncbi:MAG TPA: lysophospholipid acyltransferase family protein [Puia sp.]|nr:lysophospholipid acyltransferase family protein [Puia sp.]